MGAIKEGPIREELKLTEAEEAIITGASTATTAQANKARAFADIYVTKKITAAIDNLIQSNVTLSQSNDRYARAMNILTAGLLIAALVQMVVQLCLD
jgi:hypothetical protein